MCCRSVVLDKQLAAKKLEVVYVQCEGLTVNMHSLPTLTSIFFSFKGNHEDTKESTDWVSISLEMEHWNLLVNQLEDILNLVVFCLTLETGSQSQPSEQPRDLSKCQKLLSSVNVLSKKKISTLPHSKCSRHEFAASFVHYQANKDFFTRDCYVK